jgi:hypothetical protein
VDVSSWLNALDAVPHSALQVGFVSERVPNPDECSVLTREELTRGNREKEAGAGFVLCRGGSDSHRSLRVCRVIIGTASGPAQSNGCFTAAVGAGWVNKPFTPQSGLFTVVFSATPSGAGAQMDR